MLGSWDRRHFGRSNLGSKLAHRVASNKLAASFTAFNTSYSDTGLFGVHAVTEDSGSVDDLAWCIMKEARMFHVTFFLFQTLLMLTAFSDSLVSCHTLLRRRT